MFKLQQFDHDSGMYQTVNYAASPDTLRKQAREAGIRAFRIVSTRRGGDKESLRLNYRTCWQGYCKPLPDKPRAPHGMASALKPSKLRPRWQWRTKTA